MNRMRRLGRLAAILALLLGAVTVTVVGAVAFWPSSGSSFNRDDVEHLSQSRINGWQDWYNEYRAVDCSDMKLRANNIWMINCHGEQWRGNEGSRTFHERFWFILLFDDDTGHFIDYTP